MSSARWYSRAAVVSAVVSVVLGALASPASVAYSQPRGAQGHGSPVGCTAVELPTMSGARVTTVVGSDGHGTYVGTATDTQSNVHGLMWRDGEVTEFGGGFVPADMNEHGLVVGNQRDADGVNQPVVMDHGVIRRLPGVPSGAASGVNDRGDVVGMADGPVLWPADEPGTVRRLDQPGNGTIAFAQDIDETGLILGHVVESSFAENSTIWRSDGSVVTAFEPEDHLDLLDIAGGRAVGRRFPPGPFALAQVVVLDVSTGEITVVDSQDGIAHDINDRGMIAGESGGAVVWRADQRIVLPPLPDGSAVPSAADLVTRDGRHVAGRSRTPDGSREIPTLWTCRN